MKVGNLNQKTQTEISERQDYTRKIIGIKSPEQSYELLTNQIGTWWTSPESKANSIGDEPTFRFGDAFWTMKVINLEKNRVVRWKCIVAHHVDTNVPIEAINEWEGTEIEFIIRQHEQGSEISLTHYGLIPSLNCFTICQAGWDYYFAKTLSDVLNSPVV
ncbi:MAG: hypothetical protein ACC656_06620 [Candidatus Heimdallarchaeota archaeon]